MTDRELMQQALDMLNEIADDVYCDQKLEGVITALRERLAQPEPVQCEPQEAITEDGWCDWVCPKPQGYLMQCCDCELIHEVESRVVKYEPRPSEMFEVVNDPDLQVQWRMKRRDDISPKHEREKVAAWMIQRGFATGHGDTIKDLLKELEWQIAEREREECAKVCDVLAVHPEYASDITKVAAQAIRARGNT